MGQCEVCKRPQTQGAYSAHGAAAPLTVSGREVRAGGEAHRHHEHFQGAPEPLRRCGPCQRGELLRVHGLLAVPGGAHSRLLGVLALCTITPRETSKTAEDEDPLLQEATV
eukprot:scaffold146_cov265-Pinguiococcus_pyrenoidosus.AAC.31